jgi:hypothetical protein
MRISPLNIQHQDFVIVVELTWIKMQYIFDKLIIREINLFHRILAI